MKGRIVQDEVPIWTFRTDEEKQLWFETFEKQLAEKRKRWSRQDSEGWINVRDELPSKYGTYLVWCSDKTERLISRHVVAWWGWRHPREWCDLVTAVKLPRSDVVTHWQPLPKSPEQEPQASPGKKISDSNSWTWMTAWVSLCRRADSFLKSKQLSSWRFTVGTDGTFRERYLRGMYILEALHQTRGHDGK